MSRKIQINLPAPHSGQLAVLASATRFNVLDCGRRWGKNILGYNLATRTALDGYPVGWFAPTYKILNDAWRDLKQLLEPVTRTKSETEHRLELITNGVIECWSLDTPDEVARSRKYKRTIVDEAARAKGLETTWQAAIRPTLTDYIGDAWFLSTPKGRNYFWQLFQLANYRSEWSSYHFTSYDNPHIAASEIDAARDDLPSRTFAQEYLAEFLEDGGGVFRGVRAVSVATPYPTALRAHQYVFGVDWGKLNDFTVISVMDITAKKQCHITRFNQIDYRIQLEHLEKLYVEYRPTTIIAEQNSIGIPLIETLHHRGLPVRPFTTTNATKAEIIDRLALSIERGDIQLLNDDVQINELEAYEAERLPSGAIRYGSPEGFHDDTVIALALANSAFPQQGSLLLFGDSQEWRD